MVCQQGQATNNASAGPQVNEKNIIHNIITIGYSTEKNINENTREESITLQASIDGTNTTISNNSISQEEEENWDIHVPGTACFVWIPW